MFLILYVLTNIINNNGKIVKRHLFQIQNQTQPKTFFHVPFSIKHPVDEKTIGPFNVRSFIILEYMIIELIVIQVLEKLYRERWGPEDGVGSIIISPTRELAHQLFEVLQRVGKHHGFSAGLLIGGRKDIETEKERVNYLNILVCTPGRLLDHMSTTPNFDCSELKVKIISFPLGHFTLYLYYLTFCFFVNLNANLTNMTLNLRCSKIKLG